MSRAARRRSWGKRQLRRKALRITHRIFELADMGLSSAAIASSVELSEVAALEVLDDARADEDIGDRGGGG